MRIEKLMKWANRHTVYSIQDPKDYQRVLTGTMVISQYRQGGAPRSKYEVHGLQKRVNKRAAQFELHKRYAMS